MTQAVKPAVYELAVVYQTGDTEASTKVAGLISQAGGQIQQETAWEERDLAYPIKNQTRGIYSFYQLDLPATAISQLENNLNITAGVLRHLITKIDHRARARAEAISQRLADRQPAADKDETKPETAKAGQSK